MENVAPVLGGRIDGTDHRPDVGTAGDPSVRAQLVVRVADLAQEHVNGVARRDRRLYEHRAGDRPPSGLPVRGSGDAESASG